MTASLLERLAAFDTPTICNVIELFNIRPRNTGYLDGRIQACFPDMPPMVGYALTSGFRSAAPSPGGKEYGGFLDQLERFADLPGPAVVVFQDLDDPPAAATFGEVMCSAYKAFGSTGLITSGAGRDLLQVEALDYPVFTNGTICSHGYTAILHIGLPVHVGGITLETGELLHGDANGVTTIPQEIASAVADVSAEFVAAERIMLDYLHGEGEKKVDEFRKRRAAFQDEVRKIVSRI